MKHTKTLLFAAIAFLVIGGIVFAQGAATAPAATTAPVAPAVPLGKAILQGIIGGVLAAFVGWMKNRENDTQQPFDLKYMVSTVIVGGLIGAVAGWKGMSIGDTENWLEQSMLWGAIVAGGEMALKAVFRQGAPRLMDLINLFKKGAANPTPK
jgi:H+/Cl- antiporter ClcA